MTAVASVQELLSARGRNASEGRPQGRPGAGLVMFTAGFPDPVSLPYDGIAQATSRLMETHEQGPLQYGSAQGHIPLLNLLVEKLGRDQGIACTRENLILTSGGSQALALLCDLFIDTGDTILSEAPTWAGAVRAFKNLGAKVESIPLDAEGTRVDVLEQTLKDLKARGITPKAFYIIPNFQNPGGMTTTLARRKRIIELAREYNFAIFEDDAYHDLRFNGEKVPSLYELDGGEHTFYFGTFSKIVAPGMRIGWIVGQPAMIARLGVLKVDGGSPFATHIAYEYAKDGVLEARIEELKTLYKHRRDVIIGELNERMPEGVTWTVPDGGFFVWLQLPDKVDSTRILPKAREMGVDFLPGTANFFNGEGKNNIRLSFSYVNDEESARGIAVISELIQAELNS